MQLSSIKYLFISLFILFSIVGAQRGAQFFIDLFIYFIQFSLQNLRLVQFSKKKEKGEKRKKSFRKKKQIWFCESNRMIENLICKKRRQTKIVMAKMRVS